MTVPCAASRRSGVSAVMFFLANFQAFHDAMYQSHLLDSPKILYYDGDVRAGSTLFNSLRVAFKFAPFSIAQKQRRRSSKNAAQVQFFRENLLRSENYFEKMKQRQMTSITPTQQGLRFFWFEMLSRLEPRLKHECSLSYKNWVRDVRHDARVVERQVRIELVKMRNTRDDKLSIDRAPYAAILDLDAREIKEWIAWIEEQWNSWLKEAVDLLQRHKDFRSALAKVEDALKADTNNRSVWFLSIYVTFLHQVFFVDPSSQVSSSEKLPTYLEDATRFVKEHCLGTCAEYLDSRSHINEYLQWLLNIKQNWKEEEHNQFIQMSRIIQTGICPLVFEKFPAAHNVAKRCMESDLMKQLKYELYHEGIIDKEGASSTVESMRQVALHLQWKASSLDHTTRCKCKSYLMGSMRVLREQEAEDQFEKNDLRSFSIALSAILRARPCCQRPTETLLENVTGFGRELEYRGPTATTVREVFTNRNTSLHFLHTVPLMWDKQLWTSRSFTDLVNVHLGVSDILYDLLVKPYSCLLKTDALEVFEPFHLALLHLHAGEIDEESGRKIFQEICKKTKDVKKKQSWNETTNDVLDYMLNATELLSQQQH